MAMRSHSHHTAGLAALVAAALVGACASSPSTVGGAEGAGESNGVGGVALPPAASAEDKLDPAVRAAMDSGRTRQVILLGRTQLLAPSGGLDEFRRRHVSADRLALRRDVVAELERIAGAEQREILGALGRKEATRVLWLVNAVVLTLTPDELRRAAELDAVRFIYPSNETIRPQASPGALSALLPRQSRLPFTAQGKRIAWNVERVGAPRVWREMGNTGEGSTVAVLDVGTNYMHPDLRSNVWVNEREIPANGRDDDGNGYVDDVYGYDFAAMHPDIRDTSSAGGHGTVTAGIVGGDGTAGIITGVAPRARLMLMRGNGPTAAALAYQYAIENGADVMSMSFSIPDLGNLRGFWRMMSDHAVAAGLVLAGGAGNFRMTRAIPVQHWSPKDVPSVISVGGVDSTLALATFSSGGPAEWSTVALYNDYPMPAGLVKPDIVAFPGPHYPLLRSPEVPYTDPNTQRRGNSLSGPQAAGVAALILSSAPWLPAWRVREVLEQTARDLGPPGKDNDFGAGLLDAYAALKHVSDLRRTAGR